MKSFIHAGILDIILLMRFVFVKLNCFSAIYFASHPLSITKFLSDINDSK